MGSARPLHSLLSCLLLCSALVGALLGPTIVITLPIPSSRPGAISSSSLLRYAPSSPDPAPLNSTSWDGRELLPYVLKLTTPAAPVTNLGTHHLPPLISKGDVVVVNGDRLKVRRVRFLYKMEAPQMKYKVTKKVLDVTHERRAKIER